MAPCPAASAALADDLRALLGPSGVGVTPTARRAASADFAYLSPVLSAALPGTMADLVAYPSTPDAIAAVVALAGRHGVPVTPRGRGTGNYGQAVPLAGGLVLDTSRADAILDIGPGRVRVAAGAQFAVVEAAARAAGQELAMMPTTVGSTVGGFLAGGAGGVGSIENGLIWDGFLLDGSAVGPSGPVDDVVPHDYGVTGIVTEATVRLVPAREWVALFATARTWADAVSVASALVGLDPVPRLVSVDDPGLTALYPADPALPPGAYSVRALLDVSTVELARRAAAWSVVRPAGVGYVTSLAFNHVTLRARRARPSLCHLQVGGPALLDRVEEVRAVLPGTRLHLDAMRGGFGGLLLSEYPGVDALYAGIDRLRELGVLVIDPHTWQLGGPMLPTIRDRAREADPAGLLNPGKLPP